MTPEQKELILRLVRGRSAPSISHEEFQRLYPASDGIELSVTLLRDAIDREDAEGVWLAMIVAFSFGVCDAHLEFLLELSTAEWHDSHEDVVDALDLLNTEDAIESLYWLTHWVPPYVEEWQAEFIPIKAIWALSKIPGAKASAALRRVVSGSQDDKLRELAQKRLDLREGQA